VCINALTYGAVGDGLTDDTAALQQAIAATPSGGILFFPPGRYRVLSGLTVTQPLTLQGSGAGSYNSAPYGSAAWSAALEHGTVIEAPAASGAVLTFSPTNTHPLNLRDLAIKGLGDATRTTTGVILGGASGCNRALWSNVTLLNLAVGLSIPVEGSENCFTGLVANGCAVGVSLGPNVNQNVWVQLSASACGSGFLINEAGNNAVYGGAFQGCTGWACDLYGPENSLQDVYFENVAAVGGAIICRALSPGVGDANHIRRCHFGTPADAIQFDSNGNLLEVMKYAAGPLRFSAGSEGNRLVGNYPGTISDLGSGNSQQPLSMPVLATGANHSVDDVIKVLQQLGLVAA
jgi:hypothetical protein